MTPAEAYAVLCSHFNGDGLPDPLSAAWRALDAALSSGGELPPAWQRLTATAASQRAGKRTYNTWLSLVAQGSAPPPDGHDEGGRAFWHPATIDAYLAGEWRRQPSPPRPSHLPPPLSGPGSTREDWAKWASTRGVTVQEGMKRNAIREECREVGLI